MACICVVVDEDGQSLNALVTLRESNQFVCEHVRTLVLLAQADAGECVVLETWNEMERSRLCAIHLYWKDHINYLTGGLPGINPPPNKTTS